MAESWSDAEPMTQRAWRLDMEAVDNTIADALRRRVAHRGEGAITADLPDLWRERAREVLEWPRRTHFAAVICGLIAKVADPVANPLSLQVGQDRAVGRYNANAVWVKFYNRARASVAVNGLKTSPFVNGRYDQKPLLATDWGEDAMGREVAKVTRWMTELAGYDPARAQGALDAFLLEVPDAREVVTGEFEFNVDLAPEIVLQAIETFLAGDAEHGRRAQAFVAACLSLVHDDDVWTPQSINDPSRRAPGDVTVTSNGKALAAEAKWRTVTVTELSEFADTVSTRVPGATVLYGALVNEDSGKPVDNEWRAITRSRDALTAVYDNPARLFRDAVIWSALPFPAAVARFCTRYLHYLQHIAVHESTVSQWLATAKGLGMPSPGVVH